MSLPIGFNDTPVYPDKPKSDITAQVQSMIDASLDSFSETLNDKISQAVAAIPGITQPYKTPQDYGAVADGTTDDTAAFNAALAGGGFVYIPEGHYRINGVVITDSYTTIIGAGENTILEATPTIVSGNIMISVGSTGTPVERNHIKIMNLTFRGSMTVHSSERVGINGVHELDLYKAKHVEVCNCRFQNNLYTAIELRDGSSNINIHDNIFECMDVSIGALGSKPVNDIIIRNNFFSGLSSYNNFVNSNSEPISIYTQCIGSVVSKRWLIENCIFEYKKTNCIAIHETHQPEYETAAVAAEDITIRNILVRYCTGAITMTNCKNVTVENVVIDGTGAPTVDTTGQPDDGTPAMTPDDYSWLPYRFIQMARTCSHITVRNCTCNSDDVVSPIYIGLTNSAAYLADGSDRNNNILLENMVLHGRGSRSGENNPLMTLKGDYITARNIRVYTPADATTSATISLSDLKHSYIDVQQLSTSKGKVAYTYTSSVENTVFIVNTDPGTRHQHDFTPGNQKNCDFGAKIVFSGGGTPSQTNTWKFVGDRKVVQNRLVMLGTATPENFTDDMIVSFQAQTMLDNSKGMTTNFPLLGEFHEMTFRFISTLENATWEYPSDINVTSSYGESNLYSDRFLVSKLRQINGYWIEISRTYEYLDGVDHSA